MDKTITLTQAAELVRPGDTLALGGMLLYRRPVAFALELAKQRTGRLNLLAMTCGYESDLLVGAGLVERLRTCYFGLEGLGLAPMFTAAAGAGAVQIVEETEASIAWGVRAAVAGVGYLPSNAWRGTDIQRVRPDVKEVTCPYTGERLVAFPALRPDVLVMHALQADRAGNAVVVGNLALDQDLAMCARKVIVTAERVVDTPDLEGDIVVPGQLVTAVVEAPNGAWPTSCYPNYPVGISELMRYVEACDGGRFSQYLAAMLASTPVLPAGAAAP
jgi:glutaconate CoA-transferase, subunit A